MSQEKEDEMALMQFFRNFNRLMEGYHLASQMLDDPKDRLFHAQDSSWWKREGNRLMPADAPDGFEKKI